MQKILVNNGQTLVVDFLNSLVKLNQVTLYFGLYDEKGRLESSDYVSEPEIVSLHNLIILLYDNGITVEELLVYGNELYQAIDRLKKKGD